jgi:hypothetical protein
LAHNQKIAGANPATATNFERQVMVKFVAKVPESLNQNSDPVMDFVMCLLHSVTNAHILHLSTQSYSAHKALGNFYGEMGDLIDAFVEAFQGKYGLLTNYKPTYQLPEDPLAYMMYLKDEVARLRVNLNFPQDPELQNEVDNIANLINSTLYKLRFLK